MNYDSLYSKALLESLSRAPLLVGDLPEAPAWNEDLGLGFGESVLNFEQKLGHLYEDALACLICESERWDLLAKNLQVSDVTGRTIGEMDFLVRDLQSGECFQLELAVKFYLSVFCSDGSEKYPGPDPRDNWVNKLNRMREQQLRLSETSEARRLLAERFGIAGISVFQRVYGIVFDPMLESRRSRPPSIGGRARRAKWLYAKDFKSVYAGLEQFRIVPKCLWPVQMNPALLASLDQVSKAQLLWMAEERCVLFWDEGNEDVVFLVSDLWPCL